MNKPQVAHRSLKQPNHQLVNLVQSIFEAFSTNLAKHTHLLTIITFKLFVVKP